MRFYRLTLTNTDGQVYVPNTSGGFSLVAPGANVSTFTSHLPTNTGGLQYNPGSLNIEFDAQTSGYAILQSQSWIRVSGVGLGMIGQASNFNFGTDGPTTTCALFGGMQQGLGGRSGLANPTQAGLLFQGPVLQGFGNWQGTNQTLELLVNPGAITPEAGISFTWAVGQPLAAALLTTFQQAYPGYQVSVNIVEGLRPRGLQQGCYNSMTAFAGYLADQTRPAGEALGIDGYGGVQISFYGKQIRVYDQTTQYKTVQLNFQDLIGQATWINFVTLNFKTVMRGDINVGDAVVFPPGVIAPYALTSPQAAVPGAPSRSKSIFQGQFKVQAVHHFANYRQADADSWVTTFDVVAQPQ